MPKFRLTLSRALVLVAITAVLLVTLIVPVGRIQVWRRVGDPIFDTLVQMQPTQPGSIKQANWDCARDWVVTAFSNIYSSPETFSTGELKRFRDDLNGVLSRPIDLGTLKWIWFRLGETGPLGRRYTENYEFQFRWCFPPGTW